jgi:hypothetical protein
VARNTVIHATLYLQDQVTAQSEDELQNATQCEHNTALYFEYFAYLFTEVKRGAEVTGT